MPRAKEDAAEFRSLLSVAEALIESKPAPKRIYTRKCDMAEVRRFQQLRKETGVDPTPNLMRPAGRPKGSKNKERGHDIGEQRRARGPYKREELTVRTVRRHFQLFNGRIERIVGGKSSGDCRVKRGGLGYQGHKEEWKIKHGNIFYSAALVAFWLIHGRDPDEDKWVWFRGLPHDKYDEFNLVQRYIDKKKDAEWIDSQR